MISVWQQSRGVSYRIGLSRSVKGRQLDTLASTKKINVPLVLDLRPCARTPHFWTELGGALLTLPL